MLSGDRRLEDIAFDEWRDSWRLVTRSGELADGGSHVARRQEVGAEALLQARNELESVAEEHAALLARRDAARAFAEEASAAVGLAEADFRESEEGLREAERRAGRPEERVRPARAPDRGIRGSMRRAARSRREGERPRRADR